MEGPLPTVGSMTVVFQKGWPHFWIKVLESPVKSEDNKFTVKCITHQNGVQNIVVDSFHPEVVQPNLFAISKEFDLPNYYERPYTDDVAWFLTRGEAEAYLKSKDCPDLSVVNISNGLERTKNCLLSNMEKLNNARDSI